MTSRADVERLLRELAPQVLGATIRRFRQFDAAEEAVQEALLAAASAWPTELPDNPRGWLLQVAARKMIDHLRSELARKRRDAIVVSLVPPELQIAPPLDTDEAAEEQDDTLLLLFMCCHPALSTASAIALTLRAVGGLTTAEIARAFFVPEPTMAQRISRAKHTIKTSAVPFRMPAEADRDARLGTVLHVLYLVYSEGYAASEGAELQRTDLSGEAIRLARILATLLPNEGEAVGLLALMLLTDARRLARSSAEGALIPLDQQDRSLWDAAKIAEGVALVTATLPRGTVGAYQVQAAIAAVHDEAARAEDTDWPQILALYTVLQSLAPNPMVTLNVAIATAMVHGPAAGLQLLEGLQSDARLAMHHRLDAVRAHLLERAGDFAAAAAYYRTAAERTQSLPERNYLLVQASRAEERIRP